jgi:SagB-type dehydrogenase family enzyme
MKGHNAQSYIDADLQPPDMRRVNWKAAPLRFKLYRGCEQIRCTYADVEQAGVLSTGETGQAHLGQLLSDIYGFTRQQYTTFEGNLLYQSFAPQSEDGGEAQVQELRTFLLRPVPSGGSLYPCELYLLVGPQGCFPAGIYHYDAAHHALDILRSGDYSSVLRTSLAYSGDSLSTYTLLLSCFFWKDGFKYGAFSYRLQGLDCGALIAQSEIIGSHYGLEAAVHYQFLDRAIDELLGLDPLHESVYTVINLVPVHQAVQKVAETALAGLQEETPILRSVPEATQLESITRWPLPAAVHQASLFETHAAFSPPGSLPSIQPAACRGSQPLPPPDASLNLWQARHKRCSAAGTFRSEALSEEQLSNLLYATLRPSLNDIDGRTELPQHTLLYCIVNHVQNIPPGIYCYQPAKHMLEIISSGEVQQAFQEVLKWPEPKLFHIGVCLVPVARYQDGFQIYGDRWYRMQNMEAGIVVQRLYLAAAALKLGCRASLGYHVAQMNRLLSLPEGYTSLIQVLIAPECAASHSYKQSLLM